MKNVTKLFVLIALTIFTQGIEAQPWIENVKSENPTFQDIQKSFYDYWIDKTIEKGTGYKQFKRWEWYWEPRIFPDGHFPSSSITWDEYQKYLEIKNCQIFNK